jgi:hypothetical protein
MSSLKTWARRVAALIVVASLCAILSPTVRAQGKQAVVIFQSPGGAANSCDGVAEIRYQVLYNFKINNKDDIRPLSGLADPPSAPITRRTYDDAKKSKIREAFSLAAGGDGVFYVVTFKGQAPLPFLPDDKKPERNEMPPLPSFYSVMLSGEAREGKQKRTVTLPLQDVRRIYLTAEGAAANDSLFNHAAEEKSVGVWEGYLKQTNGYRLAEANRLMREALVVCAQGELEKFKSGNYPARLRARQLAERAASQGDETANQLLARIRQEEAMVVGQRNQFDQLLSASKWDEAITAAEPLKKYLSTWPDLAEAHKLTLRRSHDLHLFEGKEALKNNRLEAALPHCTTAWNRLPASTEARACVCESRQLVALKSAQTSRLQKRPKDAVEALEKQLADADCGSDPRLTAMLREARCEYSQQLLAEARQLITTPSPPRPRTPQLITLKPLTPQNKGDFRTARAKLEMALKLCANEPSRTLLGDANQRLSAYCLAEARKALQRSAVGTAYAYLQTAKAYTPSESAVLELEREARERLMAATTVGVGADFNNRSGDSGAEMALNELAAELEGAARGAGLERVNILDRQETAAARRAIQSGRPLATPTVIFFGELLTASVRHSATPRQVSSAYWVDNPTYREADGYYAAAKRVYEACKDQYGKPQCSSQEAEVNRLDAIRKRYPKRIEQPYVYGEMTHRVDGALKLSFRVTDSVSRGTGAAETLEDRVAEECLERRGVHQDEKGWGVRDTACVVKDEQAYLAQMAAKVKREARSGALAHLSRLPHGYYQRAQSSINKSQSVEDYLLFLFISRNKTGSEAEAARRFLESFDTELKTDGVLR